MIESCVRCTGPIPESKCRRAFREGRIPKFCSPECWRPEREEREQKENNAVMTLREIGQHLGISHASVSQALQRALRKLRGVPELKGLLK